MWPDEVTALISPLLVLLVLTLVYYRGIKTYNHWAKLGLPTSSPKYPYLGDWYETAFSVKPACQVQRELYGVYSRKEPLVGLFQFRRPVLFVTDPNLIKVILVKDFEKFGDRGLGVDTTRDPLAAGLVNLEGRLWDRTRRALNPAFKNNLFLKEMYSLVMECCDNLIENILRQKAQACFINEIIELCAIQIVVSSVLGISPREVDPILLKQEFSPISRLNRLKMALRSHLPLVENKTKPSSLLLNLLGSALERSNPRTSFLKLLLGETSLSELEIKANVRGFFIAGVEATTRTLCFALYELAENADVQDKLYREIVSEIGFETSEWDPNEIYRIKYLDQILTETLRKYPGVPSTTRVTRHECLLNGFSIPKGTKITIPIFSLQRDPNHFPQPEVFRPERSPEEYKRGVYLPFGDGPRGCIGQKMSLRLMKIALCRLLINFRFKISSKMVRPLEFDGRSFFLIPKGGIWLEMESRTLVS